MTPLTQAPLDATGRNPQPPALARATPNPTPDSITLPDGLALWAGREEFLAWCRERGVKGSLRENRIRDCLVARAFNYAFPLRDGGFWTLDPTMAISRNREGLGDKHIALPHWLSRVVSDYDADRLPEFTEC